MKKRVNENFAVDIPVIFVFIVLFVGVGNIFGQGQDNQCTCDSGTPVKFEWNDNTMQFDLVDGDATGLTITGVELDNQNEPRCITWLSTVNFVQNVCIEAGGSYFYSVDYDINNYDPTIGQSEENCIVGWNGISYVVFCVNGPLPVEMTLFSVTVVDNLAQLNWETATEVNNYGFEIQRKTEDGEWQKIGFVEGHGNSNSPKYYSFIDVSVTRSGKYYYRLKQIDIDGQYEYSHVVNINLTIAEIAYHLNQNYPNPFNPTTTISYTLPEQTFVQLTIYNVFGEEVTKLVNNERGVGTHTVVFNASNLASGMYYYTLETEDFIATKKLILLK